MDDQQLNTKADLEKNWPCQRLRIGWALLLWCVFEVLIGHKLPKVVTGLMMGGALALLTSAMLAIRQLKLATRVSVLKDALESRAEIVEGEPAR